jgi:hypothetical protein
VVRLVRRGVSQDQALRATRSLIDRQVAANTLLAVSDDLARDVANGVSPDAALTDRMTRLVGGAGAATALSGPAAGEPGRGVGNLSGGAGRPP